MQGTMLQTQDTKNKTDIFPALNSLQPLLRFIGYWCGQINSDFFFNLKDIFFSWAMRLNLA